METNDNKHFAMVSPMPSSTPPNGISLEASNRDLAIV